MKAKFFNNIKLVLIAFGSYVFLMFLIFSFVFTLNKNYLSSEVVSNTTTKEAENKTNTSTKVVVDNKNKNGIDINKLSTKINSGTNISKPLTDEQVVASLRQKNDKDIEYILENREALSMNYLRLLNANTNSKYFIKDVLQNKKALKFEGESVEFARKIPYFLQWDRRWGNSFYADGNIGINGCGPTCLAMVVSGLNNDKDITPITLAKYEDSKYTQGGGTSWDYFREVPKNYNLEVRELNTDKNVYFNELKKGNPIIVNVDVGDFTSFGHYVVLVGLDGEYLVINDPNSPDRSNEKWTFERLSKQIKNAWAFSKKE